MSYATEVARTESKEKICKICRKSKLYSEFTKDKRVSDGMGARCLQCAANRQKELYPFLNKKPKTEKQKNRINQWNRKWRATLSGWVCTALRGCKSRKECSITKQDIVDLWYEQKGLCAITKKPMELDVSPGSFNRPSLDRIDSKKGYHIGNIRLVWNFVNQAKNKWNDQEFYHFCKIIVQAMEDNNND